MGQMNLLEKLESGWLFPYRAKKAHYYQANTTTSACGKHTMKESSKVGLIPIGICYKNQLCNKCYIKWQKDQQAGGQAAEGRILWRDLTNANTTSSA